MKTSLRQVHLDFHTSGDIPNVAKDFNPEQFACRLQQAHVDSITCFTRCHHGYLYYQSNRFPERIHPQLEHYDLFGMQLNACHAHGLKVIGYVTLQWDHLIATEHPEWIVLESDGRQQGNGPYEAGFYRSLCLNTQYWEYVKQQVEEILFLYEVDGLFFDIIHTRECSCHICKRTMLDLKMNPEIKEERILFTKNMHSQKIEEMSAFVRSISKDISLFYNCSHIRPSHRNMLEAFTHLEIESLPTGGWGYWDFPITSRYARTLGIPVVGMTGKFHTSWGDFQSLKHTKALEYECFRSLALNSGCSIGDQLPPQGELSSTTYNLIGSIYKEVEEKEPWCIDAKPVVEIGVLSPDQFEGNMEGGISEEMRGCARLLTELSYQFDILDEYSDFSQYSLIMLPDKVKMTEILSKSLIEYIRLGGRVFGSYKSALIEQQSGYYSLIYMADSVQIELNELYDVDFFVPESYNSTSLQGQSHVMYQAALPCAVEASCEVLNFCESPFFKRDWKHFCSHRHAPSSKEISYPAIIKKENCIHVLHPVFSIYDRYDAYWAKILVDDAIQQLLPYRLCTHNGPSSVMITINEQKHTSELIIHVLHYIPERRGSKFDTVSESIPIYELTVNICYHQMPTSVMLVPQKQDLAYTVRPYKQVYEISCCIPKILGHQMVSISFK